MDHRLTNINMLEDEFEISIAHWVNKQKDEVCNKDLSLNLSHSFIKFKAQLLYCYSKNHNDKVICLN